MGAIWARRSKASAGISTKRRRTSDPDPDVEQKEPRAESPPRSSDSKRPHEHANQTSIAQATKGNDTSVTTSSPKDNEHSVRQKHTDADDHSGLLDADQDPKLQKRKVLKAAPHIRSSMAVDFQRDICKQYRVKGYCSYGDSCKFLHEREDLSAGSQVNKDWLVGDRKALRVEKQPGSKQRGSVQLEPTQLSPKDAKGCSSCGLDPPHAAVKPLCDHLMCEACFIQDSKKANAKCRVCGSYLGDVAETVH